MKNWIRKPLLWIGVLQVPVFTVMGGAFVGLVSVGVQAYLMFPSSIAVFLVSIWQSDKHYPVESYVLSAGDIRQHNTGKMDPIVCHIEGHDLYDTKTCKWYRVEYDSHGTLFLKL